MSDAVGADGPRGAAAWDRTGLHLAPRVLAEVLDGGQAFRWEHTPAGHWSGCWAHHEVQLRSMGRSEAIEWRALSKATTLADLKAYLGEDAQWQHLADTLPWRSDPVLRDVIAEWPGLRILRQPLGETLLGFLCSSNKQIVQIKAMIGLLAERFGAQPGPGRRPLLPSWNRLSEIPEDDLRACKLGYRARYLAATARRLADTPDWEECLAALPYAEAHTWLAGLPGVGPKVADCVLLFGARRFEAFPVDTWILKILAEAYGLGGWTPGQLATFGRVHFGPAAGLAQQYLFASARRRGRA